MEVQLNLLNKIQNNYVGKEVKRSIVCYFKLKHFPIIWDLSANRFEVFSASLTVYKGMCGEQVEPVPWAPVLSHHNCNHQGCKTSKSQQLPPPKGNFL